MTDRTADHDARWAEALALVERAPTASAERRLRQVRRTRLLLIIAFIVLTVVVAMVVALLLSDGGDGGSTRDDDVPTWLAVTGYCLSGLGLVVMIVGGVLIFRNLRGSRGWRSPLNVLTFGQRRELVAQLRGRTPLVPERLPLVRATADQLIAHRVVLLPQVGFLLNFAGLWIVERSTWRLVLVVSVGVLLLAAAVLGQRDADRARRFLDQHPAPDVEPDRG